MLLIIDLHFLIKLPSLLNFDSFDSQLCCSGTGYVIDFSGNFPKQKFIFLGRAAQKYIVLYVARIFHQFISIKT